MQTGRQKLGDLRKFPQIQDNEGRTIVYKVQTSGINKIYDCLCWLNASSTTHDQLDIIQREALTIIDEDERAATRKTVFVSHITSLGYNPLYSECMV